MKMQSNTTDIAKKHAKVPSKRATQLIGFLTAQKSDDLPEVLKTFKANKMPAAEIALVEELLGVAEKAEIGKLKAETKPAAK